MKRSFIPCALLFAALLAMAFTNATETLGKYIETNYFDLPFGQAKELKAQLQTTDIELLPTQSATLLGKYLSQKVLESPNPYGIDMRANYFWNIYNALPPFVSAKERHTGYNMGARDYSAHEQLMAYAIYRIGRSPENLRRIFELFKPTLTTLVSPSVYKELGIQTYVHQAIGSYNSISQTPNFKKLLQEAYNQVDTTTGSLSWEGDQQAFRKFENSAYGFSVDEVNQIIARHLKLDRYNDLMYSPWLSFWMRRNHEGNMDEVLKILYELDEIYNPQFQPDNSKAYGHEVSHLDHAGKIVYFNRWTDSNGQNIILLSEDITETNPPDDMPTLSVDLNAYHYIKKGNSHELLIKHTDSQLDCGFESRARFMEGSVSIADADSNGFSEVSFVYRTGCSSELSPDGLTLVTLENGQKYTIKGSTQVILDSSLPPLGGETVVGKEFFSVNYRILLQALQLWQAQQENHNGFYTPRIYQLIDLEPYHKLKLLGVEPFWNIDLHYDKLAYFELGQEAVWYQYTRIGSIDGGYEVEAERPDSNDFVVVTFHKGDCSDGMSDTTYPYRVTLVSRGNTYEGCGRWDR
ncbi:MAG: hypothetical protein RBT74_03875 [Tenuifilaceae bacterium]|nr:hypothetical protein [Tenuifilaceae bacterium]